MVAATGTVTAARGVGLHIVRKDLWIPDELTAKLQQWTPQSNLGRIVRACMDYLPAELAADLLDRITSTLVIESSLALVHIRYDHRIGRFVRDDYGEVGHKVVTTAGVNFIVDAFQNTTELETFKYHGLGTGSTAEAIGDTALVTELTTEYTGNVRATGTTAEGASANIYSTVATNTLDSGTPALREHGVFSASSAGTLLDRTVFASITLDGTAGDGLQSTYQLTCSAGG